MGILVVLVLVLAGIYIFLVFPGTGKDVSALHGVHYAHRGLHDNKTDAPENSLRAIKKAVEAGYGIEFDVQLSKDEIPVVFHDAALRRMCGVEGYVWDYTYKELQKFRLAESNEGIPTLKEVLDVVDGKVPLIIEFKLDVQSTRVCEIGEKLLKEYDGVYCIESFHPLAVAWYKKNRHEVIRGQLSMDFSKEEKYQGKPIYWALSNLLTNVFTRPDFIAYNHRDYKMFSRRVCRLLGGLAVAYTIKSQEEYQKVEKEFDLFIFDSFIMK